MLRLWSTLRLHDQPVPQGISRKRPEWWNLSAICVLVCMALFLGSGVGRTQSTFPVRFEEAGPEPLTQTTTLGDDGHLLDSYVVSATAPDNFGYAEALVLRSQILARCADDDGCTVRLALVGLRLDPAAVNGRKTYPPAGFSIAADGTVWTYTNPALDVVRGTNGDGIRDSILDGSLFAGSCNLYDNSPAPLGDHFQLVVIGGSGEDIRCTLRVDD